MEEQIKEQEIKQEVIDGLKGKRLMKCPFCNHTKFNRKEFTEVEIENDGEDNLTDNQTNIYFDEYEYRCKKCDKEILEGELI